MVKKASTDISIIGVGKLGLCMAASFARKKYNVIAIDINHEVISKINKGKSPIDEPGLAKLVKKHKSRIYATTDYSYAINNSSVTFIVVPTPSNADGSFSTKYVENVINEIGKYIKNKKSFHLVVLTSTVMSGTSQNVIVPLLERVSQKKCAKDFGYCYNPEFIALGSVIRDFTNPDVVLIGESDKKSGNILSEIYKKTCDNNPYFARMSFWNAELAKISFNAFITMKISFANVLADIASRMPAGDVDKITQALGAESRIGTKCLRGALSYGGPCFPRDNRAFAYFANQVGIDAKIARAVDTINNEHVTFVVGLIKEKLNLAANAKIAILGLTYKPNTNIVEESAAIKITSLLLGEWPHISVYDPQGMTNARIFLGEKVEYATSSKDCLRGADLCILATPWDEFKKLKAKDFITLMNKPRVFDCWRFFPEEEFCAKLDYLALGIKR